MNRNIRSSFLKEMGISEWTSKDSVLINKPQMEQAENALKEENLDNGIAQNQSPKTNEMWWFIGSNPEGDSQILFQNIIRVLGIGANSWLWINQEMNIDDVEINHENVPLVAFAFGQSAAQKLSGEKDNLAGLRDVVLSIERKDEVSIPLIATFDLNHLLSKPKDKALLWQDLMLARSVLQNM